MNSLAPTLSPAPDAVRPGPHPVGPPLVAARRARPEQQHGRRLTDAFQSLEGFPGLAETQRRALAVLGAESMDRSALVRLLETDLGLGLAVLRAANPAGTPAAGAIGSIPEAISALEPDALEELVRTTPTVDFFGRDGSTSQQADAHRRHVTAVQGAIHRIATLVEGVEVDALCAAALLHDVGKLVLERAHAGYGHGPLPQAGTPEERLLGERRILGVDHALVGGVLIRRLGLPRELARVVERHHSDDGDAGIGVLRLADLLAHHGAGDVVSPQVMTRVARGLGLDTTDLRALLYEQGNAVSQRGRSSTPCPLSARERDVLRRLGRGLVYKQIAGELGLSTSTVRTHLHNIYGKLGAVDRAQAVLTAVERGWL